MNRIGVTRYVLWISRSSVDVGMDELWKCGVRREIEGGDGGGGGGGGSENSNPIRRTDQEAVEISASSIQGVLIW